MSERVEIKTVGEGIGGYQVVYLDGVKQRAFSHISDDYAHTNARELAGRLKAKIKLEEQTNV